MFRSATLIFAVCFVVLSLALPAEARRIALVIGNSKYAHASVLPNPANDARDLSAAFQTLGYEVELVEDATRAALLDALRGFRAKSVGAEHAIIYYAGHGVEIDRQNFVVPVDAVLKADIDVEYETIPLDLMVAATSGATGLQLVVLDACRDNPFLDQMTRTMSTRSIGRGLAIYEPDGNSLVAYAAREGTVALDGAGQNSPYAMAFLSALQRPGLEIGQFFRQVRDSVIKETNGQQEPFLYGSLSAEPVFFRPVNPDTPATAQVSSTPTASTSATANTLLNIDLAFWQSISDSDQVSDFEDYLSQFPEGRFRPLAKRRLAALTTSTEPARSATIEAPTQPVAKAPALVLVPEEPVTLSRSEIRDLQARLNILGYRAGIEDGIAGRRTMSAIASYREARGIIGEAQIDRTFLTIIGTDVPDSQLAAYRAPKPQQKTTSTASKPKAAAPKPSTPKTNSNSQAAAAPKPAPKPKATSSFSAYSGRSYCKVNDGQVLNGRNLSDRPIWCITVLSVSSTQLKYRISYRQAAGSPIEKTVYTRSGNGNGSFGRVTLSTSGSGSLTANGAKWVASQIYR